MHHLNPHEYPVRSQPYYCPHFSNGDTGQLLVPPQGSGGRRPGDSSDLLDLKVMGGEVGTPS